FDKAAEKKVAPNLDLVLSRIQNSKEINLDQLQNAIEKSRDLELALGTLLNMLRENQTQEDRRLAGLLAKLQKDGNVDPQVKLRRAARELKYLCPEAGREPGEAPSTEKLLKAYFGNIEMTMNEGGKLVRQAKGDYAKILQVLKGADMDATTAAR